MELDFSRQWHVIAPRGAAAGGPAAFAAAELSAVIGRCPGCARADQGDDSNTERIIVLDSGRGGKALYGFSWRAAADRVEIYGAGEASLLRGAYDFLGALGARWVEPDGPAGRGERLPSGPRLALEVDSRSSRPDALQCTLVLGHGSFLEDWENRLVWAARAGYGSVFMLVTHDDPAIDAAPARLYEALRPRIAEAARRLGLDLELGGPMLSSEAFAEWAVSHPEIRVFHAWTAAQSIAAARVLAKALATARPEASLSFLACRDAEGFAQAIAEGIPPNLELLWAPRERSRGRALGDGASAINAASLASFKRSAAAWRAAGGGRVSVLEYYEDALLFKAAVPPLVAVIEGDLAAYRAAGAESIGILCAGGRSPFAPRPNAALMPRLAASPARALRPGLGAELLADWAAAAYGEASGPMLEYWRELEAAWAIDLDIEDGESAVYMPPNLSRCASDPPADWGDPWKAGLERLRAKRDRCEELFDHLRLAETSLAEAAALDETARREGQEYLVSGAVIELDCARLSAYHELAGGDARAAADIANLALSAASAARKAFSRLPDKRARREMSFLIGLYYELKLRAIRRANARSGLRRLLDLWRTKARIGLMAMRIRRAYEPRGESTGGK